jgi:hypothetical protein
MRTLDKAIEEIRIADPNTALSKYALRQILLSGAVPTVRVNRLRLVDMDVLQSYLSGRSVDNE